MKLFRYTIHFNPDDCETWKDSIGKDGFVTESGIISGPSYGVAVDLVADFYGQENIVDIFIYELMNPLCDEELKEMLEG